MKGVHAMKEHRNGISRRGFLKAGASAVALPYIVPSSVVTAKDRTAPGDTITLGMIGLGSMGLRHVKGFVRETDCRIIAVCDVDASRRKIAVGLIDRHYGGKGCADYNDFEDIIARGDLDALCIAIPDHWHAIPVLTAARARKDRSARPGLLPRHADGRTGAQRHLRRETAGADHR